MRSLVVFESMYGNTHRIASAITEGLAAVCSAELLPVSEVDRALLEQIDLVVVGGPTHAHSMTRSSTRRSAVDTARALGKSLKVEPTALDDGLREWFESVGPISARAAAFDTRFEGPPALTGRASRAISKRLKRHGAQLLAKPESFLVDRQNQLLTGQEDRARRWGEELARMLDSDAAVSA